MNYQECLNQIKAFSMQDLDIAEMEDSTIFAARKFTEVCKLSEITNEKEFVLECVKYLKMMCTKGPTFQNLIINTQGMLQSLANSTQPVDSKFPSEIKVKCFQLVANLSVNNRVNQEKIWNTLGEVIVLNLENSDPKFVNVSAMLLFNMILGQQSTITIDMIKIGKICLSQYQKFVDEAPNAVPDFLHILLDHIVCKSSSNLMIYKELESEQQKTFLYCVQDFIEDESNKTVSEELLQHLTVEFKRKSDTILKTVTTYVDSIDPLIVVALLDIISAATSQDKYMATLKNDHALFLNLGCLLQALHKIGKASDSIFNPIQSLDAMVPTSNANGDFEKQISYAFKTKLVRSLANLSHRNKKNQELAREMEILLSIFDCTNADARNPLIKEWSILAIRNLCESNVENQEIVKGLTKVSYVANPVLKEMGLESGMLRIGKQ